MPFIHVQISGSSDAALAAKVAATAGELTGRLLGKDPLQTQVMVDFIAANQVFVGGRAMSMSPQRSFHWRVTVTDETNTKKEKAAYLAAVHRAMDEVLGGAAEHSYAEVSDTRGSAYGYGGLTQEYRHQHAG